MATSSIYTRAVRMETTPPVLLVSIELQCDVCGSYEFVLVGHHVKALIQALQEVADAAPDLTKGEEVKVVFRNLQQHTPGLN